MGQRLHLVVREPEGEIVASGFYRWSGYLGQAVEYASNIVDFIDTHGCDFNEMMDLEQATLLLLATGARFTRDTYNELVSTHEYADFFAEVITEFATDVSDGIIEVDLNQIQRVEQLAESTVTLWLGAEIYFDFSGLLFAHDTFSDLMKVVGHEQMSEAQQQAFEARIPAIPNEMDVDCIYLDQVSAFRELVVASIQETWCLKEEHYERYYNFSG